MKTEGIDTIFILGDLFDNRVNIDSKILNSVLDLFNVDLKDFTIYIIVGNHDSYLESSVEINSVKAIGFFDNVIAIDKNQSITLDGRSFFLCPWITDKKAFTEELEALESHDICFGHFEFSNFLMFKGKECEKGVESDLFYQKFKLTMSGHFHTRSSKKENDSEIVYIGNPYHMTRNDIGDDRGFCILDLESLKYELINNDISLKFVSHKYPFKLDRKDIENNHVDIFVSK
jgi:DNA repair exonuclease SbcCD nuclease subunit